MRVNSPGSEAAGGGGVADGPGAAFCIDVMSHLPTRVPTSTRGAVAGGGAATAGGAVAAGGAAAGPTHSSKLTPAGSGDVTTYGVPSFDPRSSTSDFFSAVNPSS